MAATLPGTVLFISSQKETFISIIILLLSATPVYATEINKPGSTAEQCSQVEKVSSNSQHEELTALPATQLFELLRADPKEPRFFVSALKDNSAIQITTIAAVGFGENFGMFDTGQTRKRAGNLGFQLQCLPSSILNQSPVT